MKTEHETNTENTAPRPPAPEKRVGAFLKAHREARGLSLDALARQTKIQKTYLEAIEADDYESLPSGPFVNGFITSYARALGVDPDEIAPMIPEFEPPPLVDPAVRHDPEWRGPPLEIRELPVGRRAGVWTSWGLAVGATAVIVGIVLWLSPTLRGWLGFDFDLSSAVAERPEGADPASDVAESATTPGDDEDGGSAPGDEAAARTPEPSRIDRAAASADGGSRVEIDAGDRGGSSRAGQGAETGRDAQGSSRIRRLAPIVGDDEQSYQVFTDEDLEPGEPQLVEVVAHYKSYLRVSKSLDGKPVFEDVLQPGDKSTRFKYAGDLWMVVGNGGGVDIYYNGERLPPVGKFGERTGVAFRVSGEE